MDQPLSDSQAADFYYRRKKGRRHWWIWAIILLLFGGLFFWVIHQHNQSQQAIAGAGRGQRGGMTGPVPVTYATATKGSLGVYLDNLGTVTSVYTDVITPQVTGLVTEVHYREGQMVHKGDPLIDIDPRPYAAQLMEAQGTLQRDQNLLAEAEMDLKRYQDAWAKNAIPRQTLEDQEKVVEQDKGIVLNDQGTVQYDQVQLGYCHITSAIDGRVGLRLVDPGNVVTANSTTALAVVTQMTPITVVFIVAEGDLPQILEQMHAGKTLTVQAYDEIQKTLLGSGQLLTVDNQIDTTTGTVKARAQFDNSKGLLFPNQFVNTRVLVKTLDNLTLIPSSAIQHNGSADFVYVIQNPDVKDKAIAVMTAVKSGVSERGITAVTGIDPGTVVANSSFQKLVDKASVFQSKVSLPSTATTEDSAP